MKFPSSQKFLILTVHPCMHVLGYNQYTANNDTNLLPLAHNFSDTRPHIKTLVSGKKKQHKHKLFGPDFPRTSLTLTPGCPRVKKFLPTSGAAGKTRFLVRTSTIFSADVHDPKGRRKTLYKKSLRFLVPIVTQIVVTSKSHIASDCARN